MILSKRDGKCQTKIIQISERRVTRRKRLPHYWRVVVGRLRLPATPDSTHLVIFDPANPDSTPISNWRIRSRSDPETTPKLIQVQM
jgi:hypothetical protein